jgi:hypothetical protein
VEVHKPAGLKLGDLRVRHTDELAPRTLAEPGPSGEPPDQLDHEAVPQRGGVPVPQHRPLVVVGFRVDRGAKLGIVGLVMLAAPARAPVVGPAVDCSERRCRQAGEYLWVLGYRLRHALSSAGHAGVDELPHVAAVFVRARRTARLTPVAAPDHQCPIGLVHGRVDAFVAAQHDPAQPDRMTARAAPADLLQPALAFGIARPRDQAPDGRGVQLVDGRRRHGRVLRRGHKTDTSAREHADTRDNGQSSRNAHRPGQTVALMTPHHQAFHPLVSLVMNGVASGSAQREDASDHLLDVESQLAWLRELGFDDVAATGSGSRQRSSSASRRPRPISCRNRRRHMIEHISKPLESAGMREKRAPRTGVCVDGPRAECHGHAAGMSTTRRPSGSRMVTAPMATQ